ncbi:putative colanic acid biosynthesis acetyltransferase [Rubellicoccus peritrichatus]|uniref:Colanic acid biosynthesis acetyltransferase n=1 Tax=Rubellicoccus peritrichatus TaxID=3080537 RepID=A0AAQ3QXD3_9BACT|nr:putative colanic acid biosynthesis acetyltransferase [Puniceicoccus sp. CR14]WOO42932.1 putative colanic acid biosynthesis acetyltransferase [Puniceicoccus sp. CR14]
MSLDIQSNRVARKWSRKELTGRVFWYLVQPFFRFSPRLCSGWRCFLLRCFGAKIGYHVYIDPSVEIAIPWHLEIGNWSAVGRGVVLYSFGKITIGNSTTISQFAHLCAGSHDYRDETLPLLKLPITIEDQVWVCADAFIGPNVIVREGAIVAARAVAVKNVDAWAIVAGNPAHFIKKREMKS